jgi:D-alanyl-D-alanine carboxypeptidase
VKVDDPSGRFVDNVDDLGDGRRVLTTGYHNGSGLDERRVTRITQERTAGTLLPAAQRRELLDAIPVDDQGELFAERYGLGIYRVQLSCGTAWGHDGGYPGGFKTFAYTSPDGSRQAVLVYNDFKMSLAPPAGTGTAAFQRDVRKTIEIAFCGQ